MGWLKAIATGAQRDADGASRGRPPLKPERRCSESTAKHERGQFPQAPPTFPAVYSCSTVGSKKTAASSRQLRNRWRWVVTAVTTSSTGTKLQKTPRFHPSGAQTTRAAPTKVRISLQYSHQTGEKAAGSSPDLPKEKKKKGDQLLKLTIKDVLKGGPLARASKSKPV